MEHESDKDSQIALLQALLSRRTVLVASGATAAGLILSNVLGLGPVQSASAAIVWNHPYSAGRGTINDEYGTRGGAHQGMDYAQITAGSTTIHAVASGVINYAGPTSGWGNMVRINHADGFQSLYGHMVDGSMAVYQGQYVEAGTVLGIVGNTGQSFGVHLHIELRLNGALVNPKPYIHLAPLAVVPSSTPIDSGENQLLIIGKANPGGSPQWVFALFGPNFWYEWTGSGGDPVANGLLALMSPTAGAPIVSAAAWDLIKAQSNRVAQVQVVP